MKQKVKLEKVENLEEVKQMERKTKMVMDNQVGVEKVKMQ